jgi:hypothetical protein
VGPRPRPNARALTAAGVYLQLVDNSYNLLPAFDDIYTPPGYIATRHLNLAHEGLSRRERSEMRTGRWKRIACAACLLLVVACTYKASALPLHMPTKQAPKPPAAEALVRGERVLRFGGYQLNIAFTPGGRLVCFDITAAAPPPKAAPHSQA